MLQLFLILGSGILTLEDSTLVMNEWQTIKVTRDGQTVTMVTGGHVISGRTPGLNSGLSLGGSTRVGGVEDYSSLHPQAKFTTGYSGCIHQLKVRSRDFSLSSIVKSSYACRHNQLL